MKKYLTWNITFIALLLGIFVLACDKDDDVKIPEVSFETSSYTVLETSTSTLEVKVILNMNAPSDLNVNFNVGGTAVADVNYEALNVSSVNISAGSNEAVIFVNTINETAIEGNKSLEFSLIADDGYILAAENTNTVITIEDNAVAPSNAPVIQFTSDNVITNAYLQDTIDVIVGLDKAFDKTVEIPITIEGTAIADTDYEILNLTENNTLEIAANVFTAKFRITVKYNAVENLDKNIDFSFASPVVTDYVVSETNNSIQINVIDPAADYSSWFNESAKYTYFYAGGSSFAYAENMYAYRIKRYYWDPITEGGNFRILSGQHYYMPSETRNNTWEEVVHKYQKLVGWSNVDVSEQERWEIQSGEDFFGLSDFFTNEAAYGKTLSRSEKGWLRFVAFDAEANEGKVIIPAQTLIVYKVKAGFNWDESFIASDGVETYRAWYADSNTTQGNLDQSTNVDAVSVEVHGGEGTFSNISGEIIFEIKFTCNDPDFSIPENYYTNKDGDTYTMKIKYVTI